MHSPSDAARRRRTEHVPRPRRTSRLAALALACSIIAAPFAVAGPASAHDSLTGSTPADGSTLSTAPDRVTLIFSDQVKQIGLTVLVKDPSGASVADGKPTVSGNTVVQRLAPLATSGAYTVSYRVVSSDGHPISGRINFTADLPSASPSASSSVPWPSPSGAATSATPSESVVAASPVAASTSGSGGAGWVIAGAGLVALLVVVGFVLVRRRSA